MANFIDVNVLILDSNNKKFKGFPFKGKFSNETVQKQKICDENGICKLTLKVGTAYQISVLKPDDSYQEKLVINAMAGLNNSTQKIVLDDPINSYLASIILTAKDISTPPQIVPKAQIQISYMGKTSIRDTDDSGVLKLRILIGEPLQYQLVDPLSKKPMKGTHIDETIAKKMKNEVTVVQPSIRVDASLEPDKPDTTTPKPPESDMTITMAQMQKMWTGVNDAKMKPILDELNANLKSYKLDTRLRQAHFLGQVYGEIGSNFALIENLNYKSAGLQAKFGYYARNPKEADTDAKLTPRNFKIKTIANKAYMDKNRPKGLAFGNVIEGDGYKFLGRGLKQTTGRYNYTVFTKMYPKIWPKDEKIDFTEKPQLLEQPIYAARSGIVFWLDKKIYEIADQGATSNVVDNVTKAINPYAPNKIERRSFFNKIKVILA
ncbi:glycoside hydrolase family 19 protein [Acinetobacter sp. ABJ_C5_2]|uniref:glycoside hydrolase family 19 protein n=1 Tax=Acinetobacter sp. ABJ_C5_2 TaxID=3376992 RepID=UPI0037CBB282